jgi:hypothetical protein
MAVTQLVPIATPAWDGDALRAESASAQLAVEQGDVLHFAHLPFELSDAERAILDPRVADPKRKNISLEPDGRTLRGVVGGAANEAAVTGLVARFQQHAARLVDALCPSYRGRMRVAPASLRVHAVEGRASSWRKDDSRLHIDAFPSRPLAGERILRVFMNVNPLGAPRVWRVGERFEDVARRFLPGLPPFRPWVAALLHALHVTKQRRTRYDHLMLGLHDAMKADLDYQRDCAQQTVPFMPGSVWVCFSDQTSHAVMSGQHMLEQTFFLPVAAMRHPELAPLSVLERLSGARLVG